MQIPGYAGNIAIVDLSKGTVEIEPTNTDDLELFMGGRGLAHRLLEEHLPAGVDPLSPSNVLVFAPGAMVGTNVPSAGRWAVAAKSPLTGFLGSGNGGGFWGLNLKWAGFDALVIKGRANAPCYLYIRDGEIDIRPAGGLWGLDTRDTVAAIRTMHSDPRLRVATIGKPGELMVPIANIVAEERAAGRGGLGAVMGSKQLKAIAVRGDRGVSVADPSKLNELVVETIQELRGQPHFASYRKYGSSGAVRNRYGALGGLLAYNGQKAIYPYLDEVNGEVLERHYIPRSHSCAACAVGCLKVFNVADGPYAGTWGEGPQTATMIGFGARCVMTNLAAVLRAHALVNEHGLDLISVEGVVAFAMECFQKGIIGTADTDGLVLSWENDDIVLKLIELMGRQEGFGKLLGLGVRELASRWGPEAEIGAMHVKGMEITAVDPRAYPAWALMYAVSSRGADHMRAYCLTEFGEFSQEAVTRMAGTPAANERFGVEGKGRLVAYFEDVRAVSDCLGLCKFLGRGSYFFPERLVGLVQAVRGGRVEADGLKLLGERVMNAERLFNLREGLTPADDTLPSRALQERIPDGPAAGHIVELEPMLQEYYSTRGWDRETGRPTDTKLRQLGLIN